MATTAFIGAVIVAILSFVPAAIVLWIVSKLDLGLKVSGCGSALIGAMVIALINGVVSIVLSVTGVNIVTGGLAGFLVQTAISAIVLMLAGALLPGMSVKGFGGAFIAAIAIGVVSWLLGLLFVVLGLATFLGVAV